MFAKKENPKSPVKKGWDKVKGVSEAGGVRQAVRWAYKAPPPESYISGWNVGKRWEGLERFEVSSNRRGVWSEDL